MRVDSAVDAAAALDVTHPSYIAAGGLPAAAHCVLARQGLAVAGASLQQLDNLQRLPFVALVVLVLVCLHFFCVGLALLLMQRSLGSPDRGFSCVGVGVQLRLAIFVV